MAPAAPISTGTGTIRCSTAADVQRFADGEIIGPLGTCPSSSKFDRSYSKNGVTLNRSWSVDLGADRYNWIVGGSSPTTRSGSLTEKGNSISSGTTPSRDHDLPFVALHTAGCRLT